MKKIFLISANSAAAIYSIIYASIGGFVGNESALSTVGLEHPVLFFLWGITVCCVLYLDIFIAYSQTKYKFHYCAAAVSAVGMILTVCCDFDYDKYTQYILHCTGSLTFSIVTGVTVFLFFVLAKNRLSAVISAVILITDLIFLLIFKETALIELVPIFTGMLLLTVHNIKTEDKILEIK